MLLHLDSYIYIPLMMLNSINKNDCSSLDHSHMDLTLKSKIRYYE